MKKVVSIFSVLFLISCGLVFGNNPQGLAQKLFVKVEQENLRARPNGTRIGQLLKGTELTVLVEESKWVKVQVTGWIWKESLTKFRPALGELRALHILVKTRTEAEEILQQIHAGADFKELAKKRSIGPNRAKGGDLGYFSKGDFLPEIEEAILNLQLGEVSEIVKTKYGYHIFKRIE